MTVRTFSMSAGLAASTVTPGSTAPEASLTTPAIPLAAACWAAVDGGRNSAHITTPKPTTVRTMGQPSSRTLWGMWVTTNALTGLSSLQNCAAPPGLVLCAFGSRYLQENYERSTESFPAIRDSVHPSPSWDFR